jgi:RNA polymerase sigma-70 factor, ECF subfamily
MNMAQIERFIGRKKIAAIWNLRDITLSNNILKTYHLYKRTMTKDQIPEEELVLAAQQGDTRAFEGLVVRYQRPIFSLIYQMTRDVEVVEDLGQEIFIAAFRAIKDFKARSSFFTWLYRIAINHCKNYLASSSRVGDIEKRYQDEQRASGMSNNQERNPQRMLLTKEFVEHIDQAINALPEDQRIVLTLCEFEGLSYQEMAEVLECPIGTVRSRLSRARSTLQELLGELL